ncbi:DUF7144 family membrane protein [Micromonospora sp. CPCC 206061]|uniref:DUF7144 family membrane protein n=1 Tax=Micromonospora sp. CPCC 206061 TaxID=3122410 RepID=UPI002FF40EC2
MGRRRSPEQAWATGGMVFAATMLLMVGVWQVFVGIAAIANDGFLVAVRGYTYDIDTTAWGWIHVALGALVILTGFFLFTGAAWARGVGIALAAISAINNFIFLPYYPLWAIVVIALDVFIIWSLATVDTDRLVAGRETAAAGGSYETLRSGERWPTNRPATGRVDEPSGAPVAPEGVTNTPPTGRQ